MMILYGFARFILLQNCTRCLNEQMMVIALFRNPPLLNGYLRLNSTEKGDIS